MRISDWSSDVCSSDLGRFDAMTDLWTRSATELSLLLREREVSPVELLQHLLDRCDSLNDALNAIVTFDREGALAAARASEARYAQGRPLGPLDGIPITVKDNIFVRGLRATRSEEH